MLVHPCPSAMETTSSGGTLRVCRSPGFAAERCQFWHQGQVKLQPTLLMENARLPGWKWARGFFSIGSTAIAESWP